MNVCINKTAKLIRNRVNEISDCPMCDSDRIWVYKTAGSTRYVCCRQCACKFRLSFEVETHIVDLGKWIL